MDPHGGGEEGMDPPHSVLLLHGYAPRRRSTVRASSMDLPFFSMDPRRRSRFASIRRRDDVPPPTLVAAASPPFPTRKALAS
uniref:Predicted protein n=1 Tax=Hordeum vulgare subsp. vulgare TaxID=112509 RepID=F2DT05_HORVV|nr:predicted protein [Hordeum vulgare subsp. vulgare]